MDQIRSRNIKKQPEVKTSIPFPLPKHLDEGNVEDFDGLVEFQGDDSDDFDAGGFPGPGGGGGIDPGTGDGLAAPTNIIIKSQTIRQAAGGQTVVDVIVSCDDVPGATNYEVRIAKA